MGLSRYLAKLGQFTNSNGLLLPSGLANNGYELSDKNFIVNGGLNVWQRATSFTRNQLANAEFAADRFWIYSYAASSGTVDRSTDVPTGEGLLYSLASSLNVNVPFGTNVELLAQGSAAPFAVNKTYVLSFWIKGAAATSNLTMGINWRNVHADGTNSTAAVAANPTFNVTTSWAKVVLPFTINAAPHANNKVLDFESVLPAGAKIAGWKLEPGYNETPLIQRLPAAELALCQRYYQKLTNSPQYTSFGSGMSTGSTTASVYVKFTTTMRTAPTVTYSDLLITDNASYVLAVTAGTMSILAGTDAARISVANAATASSFRAATLAANATSSFLDFSAEL